ncbi:MAG: hypothetical protein JSS32_04460 [Verrucomicrobia bacterium]|nr:hypothetical protein [Verrucomicrobiota bacterium]
MMPQVSPLRRIFSRFFPRKYAAQLAQAKFGLVPVGEKKEQALHYLFLGELALLQGNLSALSLFETAANFDPDNALIWYRQGLAFFEYGSLDGKEKALLLASKNFKVATQLNPAYFDAWAAWGTTLLQLGRFHEEHHFFLEARDKYQKAIELAEGQSKEALAELYWDYGLVWSEISDHSGEAIDVRLSIQSFEKAVSFQEKPCPEFWNDMGNAYIQMGLLINDSRYYLQSIDYLSRSVSTAPLYADGWASLALALSQLYINTMNDRFASRACECLARAAKNDPRNSDIWLSWAQLLGEAGRLNGDPKQLGSSIEKCAKAYSLDPKNPTILSQWVESLSNLGALTGRLDLLIEAENKILKAVDHFSDDPDLWRAYGLCLIGFGKYYEDPDYFEFAIEKLQYGLSLDRTDAELWHALGIAHKLYAEMTDDVEMIERASRFLMRAIDLKPSCPSFIYDTACSLLHYSEVEDSLPSLEQAIALFETLLQNHRDVLLHHPEWLYQYGCALEWMGDFSTEETHFSRAAEIYSQVLLIDPDYPDIHFRLGICQVHLGHMGLEKETYNRAIQSFRLAVRQDPENEKAWLEWGLCLVHLAHLTIDTETMNQLYFEAEQKITTAGSLGESSAHYHLACLYSILTRTDEAMALIRQALNLRTLPSIDEMLEDEWLDNLRGTEEFAQFLTALEAKYQPREE